MEDIMVGKVFPGTNEVFSFFNEYFKQTYQPFTINANTSSRIVFRCAHWRQRKSQTKGKRPNQHYLYTGCDARINLYKGKKNYWKVTLLELRHNHPISEDEYSRYRRRSKLTCQDNKLISILVKAKMKDSAVADVLKEKNKKFLTRKDVTNIRAKLFVSHSKEQEKGLESVKQDEVGLENEFIKDTTLEELDNITSDYDNEDILSKNENYQITMEFFSKYVDNFGTKEFYECMEQLDNIMECL